MVSFFSPYFVVIVRWIFTANIMTLAVKRVLACYLSEAPQALPQALGFSSGSLEAPQAVPQAEEFSDTSLFQL
jgi:hypothetical protein